MACPYTSDHSRWAKRAASPLLGPYFRTISLKRFAIPQAQIRLFFPEIRMLFIPPEAGIRIALPVLGRRESLGHHNTTTFIC